MVWNRPGGWILGAAATAFLLLVSATIYKIAFEELPASARPEVIERRFEAQIEFLRDLAASYPAPECEGGSPRDQEEALRLVQQLSDRQEWKRRMEEGAGLFEDPVILGASMVCYRSDGTVSLEVKPFEEPPEALSRALVFPRNRQPKVSLWYAGEKRFIKYEGREDGSSGIKKGYQLFLDADALESDPAEQAR